ncbi:MAG: GNAT family N-acetyltransferase [Bacteroidetes bacterium]|jgi:hypothetical protein|nr:GNAT family N-acetyltransferase [Bacteroidota bacterium]
MPNQRELYRTFCAQNKQWLFIQDWWLDAIQKDSWDVALDIRADKIMGGWVFSYSKKYGISYLSNTQLSPYQGIFFNYPVDLSQKKKASFENRVIKNLLRKLPAKKYITQKLHPKVTNAIPLYWKGFQLNNRYTYILRNISKPDEVWENLYSQSRRLIRNVEKEKKLKVEKSESIDLLYELHALSMRRQNRPPQFSFPVFQQLDLALKKRNRRLLLIARDSESSICGGVYIVWDATTAYYLVGGFDNRNKITGISTYLLWEAIKQMSSRVRTFDFEGSMIPDVERIFRSFGAEQLSYMEIKKYRFPLNLMKVFR